MSKIAIAIHGGAGTIQKSSLTPEQENAYKTTLRDVVEKGHRVLAEGGSALDAAELAVTVLEDSPLFNAGKGAVFTKEGKHEMDAAIMCGKTLGAGAVASVRHVKNPIKLTRAILEHSEHVMLCSAGALEFALSQQVELMPDEYFYDELRFKQWSQVRDSSGFQLDHTAEKNKKFGTVGAVALDAAGNVAAATSTGGMTNKRYSRIGDTPIIGSGTYANNKTCAVSCTGHGEFFIRSVVAYDVSCLMAYRGLSLQQACQEVVMHKLVEMGGEGGLIAVAPNGDVAMPFNSEGMYRASKGSDGKTYVAIYKEES